MKIQKTATLIALVILVCSLVPAVTVGAKKPFIGIMDLEFNLGWPGPQAAIPDWVGTITIDGEDYGMAFFAIGSGKAFDDAFKGKIHFFEEIWVIYDWMTFDFVTQELEYGQILLWGYDKGQTNIQTSKYHMNGNIEEATGDFSKWAGRNVYMSGVIEWYPFGAPHYAPGVCRIN